MISLFASPVNTAGSVPASGDLASHGLFPTVRRWSYCSIVARTRLYREGKLDAGRAGSPARKRPLPLPPTAGGRLARHVREDLRQHQRLARPTCRSRRSLPCPHGPICLHRPPVPRPSIQARREQPHDVDGVIEVLITQLQGGYTSGPKPADRNGAGRARHDNQPPIAPP
jgi:hypothetical protein